MVNLFLWFSLLIISCLFVSFLVLVLHPNPCSCHHDLSTCPDGQWSCLLWKAEGLHRALKCIAECNLENMQSKQHLWQGRFLHCGFAMDQAKAYTECSFWLKHILRILKLFTLPPSFVFPTAMNPMDDIPQEPVAGQIGTTAPPRTPLSPLSQEDPVDAPALISKALPKNAKPWRPPGAVDVRSGSPAISRSSSAGAIRERPSRERRIERSASCADNSEHQLRRAPGFRNLPVPEAHGEAHGVPREIREARREVNVRDMRDMRDAKTERHTERRARESRDKTEQEIRELQVSPQSRATATTATSAEPSSYWGLGTPSSNWNGPRERLPRPEPTSCNEIVYLPEARVTDRKLVTIQHDSTIFNHWLQHVATCRNSWKHWVSKCRRSPWVNKNQIEVCIPTSPKMASSRRRVGKYKGVPCTFLQQCGTIMPALSCFIMYYYCIINHTFPSESPKNLKPQSCRPGQKLCASCWSSSWKNESPLATSQDNSTFFAREQRCVFIHCMHLPDSCSFTN